MKRSIVALVQDYLVLRRGLGYQLASQGKALLSFARFLDRIGHSGPVTVELAVRWARLSRSTDPCNTARRLGVLRGFLRHRTAFDPANEVPPLGLLGPASRRRPPHIYSEAEIAALLRSAAALAPPGGLRPRSYVTLFALLVSTGLRISEALGLACRDVDLDTGVLTVRAGKFGKSRLIPLHPSALEPLRRYGALRDRWRGAPQSDVFFRTEFAARLTYPAVLTTFDGLRRRLGWTADRCLRRPRLHDLRHSFAVRRLVRWYQEGADLDHKVAVLATYLGHVTVTDTYWYLTAVPELMALTAQRFERFAHREPAEGTS